MCCTTYTSDEPLEFLNIIKGLEKTLERKESFRNGPRVIDIDIIFWGYEVVKKKELTIPHPRTAEREFVLRPIADLSPSFVHPVLHKTVTSLLKALEPQGVRYFEDAPRIQDTPPLDYIMEKKHREWKNL